MAIENTSGEPDPGQQAEQAKPPADSASQPPDTRPPETSHPHRDRGQSEPTETRTRQEYADQIRGQGEPIPDDRPSQSSDQPQEHDDNTPGQDTSTSSDHEPTETRDRLEYADEVRGSSGAAEQTDPIPAGEQPGETTEHAAEQQEPGQQDYEPAEPRSREEYADAARQDDATPSSTEDPDPAARTTGPVPEEPEAEEPPVQDTSAAPGETADTAHDTAREQAAPATSYETPGRDEQPSRRDDIRPADAANAQEADQAHEETGSQDPPVSEAEHLDPGEAEASAQPDAPADSELSGQLAQPAIESDVSSEADHGQQPSQADHTASMESPPGPDDQDRAAPSGSEDTPAQPADLEESSSAHPSEQPPMDEQPPISLLPDVPPTGDQSDQPYPGDDERAAPDSGLDSTQQVPAASDTAGAQANTDGNAISTAADVPALSSSPDSPEADLTGGSDREPTGEPLETHLAAEEPTAERTRDGDEPANQTDGQRFWENNPDLEQAQKDLDQNAKRTTGPGDAILNLSTSGKLVIENADIKDGKIRLPSGESIPVTERLKTGETTGDVPEGDKPATARARDKLFEAAGDWNDAAKANGTLLWDQAQPTTQATPPLREHAAHQGIAMPDAISAGFVTTMMTAVALDKIRQSGTINEMLSGARSILTSAWDLRKTRS
jgi:hypothetical protein